MLSLANKKKTNKVYRDKLLWNNVAKNSSYKNKETKSENCQHINYLEYHFHLTTLCLCPVECLMREEEGENKWIIFHIFIILLKISCYILTRKSNTKTSRNLFHGFSRTKWTHSCSAFLDSIFTYFCTSVFTSTNNKTVSASFS